MIIIGWLALVLLAIISWAFTIGGIVVERGFTGKTSPAYFIPGGFAAWVSYLVWENFPFILAP